MIRAKDTEIYKREQEILRLQKKNNELQEKLDNISDKIDDKGEEYYNNLWKTESKNSFSNDPEKVKIAIDGYQKHTKFLNVTDKEVGHTSIGINGWYLDTMKILNEKKKEKSLVDKMKDISKVQQDINEEINNPVVTEVIEEISGETTEELSDNEIKEEDNNNGNDDEESTEEEECTVTTIKHYGKEYYIIDGEDPQYIYSIENGELGKEVGEMKNGKKHMYKK